MSARSRFSRSRVPLVFVAGLSAAPAFAQGVSSIQFTAEKTLLRADGRNSTNLTAKVSDKSGGLVPDGTIVHFTTTAGRLAQSDVPTAGGVAVVNFIAADQPGQAVVTASLQNVTQSLPSRLIITFSADADAAEARTPWINISGPQYTGYIADNGIVRAVGKEGTAEFSYRDATVKADTIQYNARENWLLAVGNVTVTTVGSPARSYNAFRYNFNQEAGLAERISPEQKPLPFEIIGAKFEEVPFAVGRFAPPVETWKFADLADAQIAVVARFISIEPGKQLQFRRAEFYAAGKKLASYPVFVMDLGQRFFSSRQLIGFSEQGLSVDVPLPYAVEKNTIGMLHIRHSPRVGGSAYAIRPGWSLDAVQTYTGPNRTTGRMELTGVTRGDWGFLSQHGQKLGADTSASLYFNSPNHRNILFNPQLSHNFPNFYVNANAQYSASPGYSDPTTGVKGPSSASLTSSLSAETYSKPVPGVKSLRYVFTGGVARQHFTGSSEFYKGETYTSSLGTRVFTSPLPLGKNATLTQSASLSNLWVGHSGTAGRILPGVSVLATTAVNYSLGDLGQLGLNYNFTRTPSNALANVYGSGKHQLGLTGYLAQGAKWDFTVAGVQGLDVRQTSLYTNFGFRIKGPLRGRVTYQLTGVGSSMISDTEYALSYRIWERDITLYYSTTTGRLLLDFDTHL